MNTKQKDPSLMKTKIVPIRFTQAQYDILKHNANSSGLTFSEYVRRILMKRKVSISYDIVVDMPELKAIARDLEGACNNLNQIAKYFHLGGMRSKQVQQEINASIRAIFEIRDSIARLEGGSIGDH